MVSDRFEEMEDMPSEADKQYVLTEAFLAE